MPTLPIFYFTYADPRGDLGNVKRERKEHRNLFAPRFLKAEFGFYQEADFSKEDLKTALKDYIDQITIFHFSGHAGTGEINTQDGLTYIEGISRQILESLHDSQNRLSKLVLVFLNGCCTATMQQQLLDAGVPIVIGSSKPVDDAEAADFSINFYNSLIGNKSIKEAFESAVTSLQITNNKAVICRGSGFENAPQDAPLWGYFVNDAHKSLLDWKLSDRVVALPKGPDKYEINAIIRGALYNSLRKAGSPDITSLETQRLQGLDISEKINAAILLGYPNPIADKIKRLVQVELENESAPYDKLLSLHLENLYNVYQSLSELLFIIMLSQLWDRCLNVSTQTQAKPALPADSAKIAPYLQEIKKFFTTTRKERKFFDYVPMIRAIRKIFDEAGISYFLAELEQLKDAMEKDQEFIDCYNYFNRLTVILSTSEYNLFDEAEWEKNCMAAEKALASFIEALAFCIRYDFGILKNIELTLPRFSSKPTYSYRLLKFPKNGNIKYISSNPNLNGFTSVRSIVMLKAEAFEKSENIQEITSLINLSPFMLDYNVTDPSAVKGNLLMYSHYEKTSGNFLYEEAFGKDAKAITKSDEMIFYEVQKTFNSFFEVLFSEEFETAK